MAMVQQFAVGTVVSFKAGKGTSFGKVLGTGTKDKILVENLNTGKTVNKSPGTLDVSSMDVYTASKTAANPTTNSRKKKTVDKGSVWGCKWKVGDVLLLPNRRKVTIKSFAKAHGVFLINFNGKDCIVSPEQLDKICAC